MQKLELTVVPPKVDVEVKQRSRGAGILDYATVILLGILFLFYMIRAWVRMKVEGVKGDNK